MLSEFMSDEQYIEKGVIISEGRPIGVLAPSLLTGLDSNGFMQICGRQGIAKMPDKSASSFWRALIESDGIIFGNEADIKKVTALLADPIYSRTLSYISTISSGCSDLLLKFDRLCASKVLVLGCGGIGSLAAMNIAGAGIGLITLVDHDVIEISNMNRQFFWKTNDIGKKKINVLKSTITERFPSVIVNNIDRKITAEEAVILSNSHDAVIITADEPLGIGEEISKESKAFIAYGAYFQGYIGYYASTQGNRPSINVNLTKWERNPYFIGPSFGPSNTELAGAVSSACIHYLCCEEAACSVNLSKIWKGDRISPNINGRGVDDQ